MRGRSLFLVALVAMVAWACTGETPVPPPTPAPSSPRATAVPLTLDVVAATGGPDGTVPRDEVENDASYLEGMRVAVRFLNAHGGVDGRPLRLRFHDRAAAGGPTSVLRETLARKPVAILYVGPGPAVPPLRSELEATRTPLLLLQGDLYTGRELFRQVFQTTIPWEWQVRVIARYLVRDRKAGRITFVGFGPEARTAAAATGPALAYWGGSLSESFTFDDMGPGGPDDAALRRIGAAEAVIDFGPTTDALTLVGRLQHAGHLPRISGGQSLLSVAFAPFPPPGTTACYTYTWAGWARPLPRVDAFISAYQNGDLHQVPGGFEQEGYDAVRALALGLHRTDGRGGNELIGALEGIHRTFSSFPVDLGPDDHVFLPRDELGLFAVPGPDEQLDPWQGQGGDVWRALMRTFTYDGQRDSLIDIDRAIFFPGWKAPQPGPEYWKSIYGITTRPSDPVH